MEFLNLNKEQCDLIFKDINYLGAKELRNYDALRIVLTYLNAMSNMKVSIYLSRVLYEEKYKDMAKSYSVSNVRIRECYDITRSRLTGEFHEVIEYGVNKHEVTDNLNIARICMVCGYPMHFAPRNANNHLECANDFVRTIDSPKLRNYLINHNFSYGELRDFIIKNGKSWFKCAGNINVKCVTEIELDLGIDWRHSKNRLYRNEKWMEI